MTETYYLLSASLLSLGNNRDTILRQMAREFQQRHAQANLVEVLLFLAVLTLAILVLWYLGVIFTSGGASPRRPSARRLFWQLARAHRLSSVETLQLWRQCRQVGLDNPVEIFALPDVFDRLTSAPAAHRGAILSRLKDRLFGGLVNESSNEHDTARVEST
ncbi:MAG: hypothetical protein NZ899_10665 [Thermoguttaceae bacterium]|nr:hypothetical protein [Thermoguttaceae bacterium]MDW8078930.1 hypothetical protein [Thermoguttaceae bacterium]